MDNKKLLIEDDLPFWIKNGLDREYGGIFTCLDKEGRLYGEDKSVWFQGRALWTFSKAFNLIKNDPEYLDAARCIYSFLGKCVDTDGRMFFTVTRDGRGIQKRRYYFSETFAAIGCAEYYRASGDPQALLDARRYFDVAYGCFTGEIATSPKFNKETYTMKALSPIMIMLSTAQTMRAVDVENRERYDAIAKECLDEILHGGFLTEKALFENVSAEGKTVDTPTGRIVNPGHSMEAAWFVLLEGLISGDREAIDAGKKIIDITLPLGLDEANDGIIAFCDVSGRPPVQLEWDMKLWWPQCETMIAARMAYDIFKEEKYLELYRRLESYCEKYFLDRENGEWYGYLHYDNTPSTTLKGNIFKGPFHIPRFYMMMSVLDDGDSIEKYAE
ncbi:MAG: N-acylglucosamine 2-epimerase [Ruminococcaceae bacterium]|nr:N-acylglucosamine 2-epimerase [Oscillospiraceae bacterium]